MKNKSILNALMTISGEMDHMKWWHQVSGKIGVLVNGTSCLVKKSLLLLTGSQF